jgi:hypothetical protein
MFSILAVQSIDRGPPFLFAFLIGSSIAAYAKFEAYGKISYYNGVGSIGSDGKVLEDYDCATKIGFDEPPAGTLIWAHNNDNGKIAAVQKWDTGTFSPGVILDVMPTVFTNALGGSIDAGFINNGYYVMLPIVKTRIYIS